MTFKAFFAITLFGLLIAIFGPISSPGLGESDFIAYWSSAHSLARGSNPYDPAALAEIQHTIFPEMEKEYVIPAWNPPWLMLILLPLGLLSFKAAATVWIFCNIALIGYSLAITWNDLTEPFDDGGFLLVLAAGLIFPAVLVSILFGQVTSLVVAGMVISIWAMKRQHDGLAGAALLLTLVKVHLVYLLLVVVLVWVIRSRRLKVLAGLAGGGIISVILIWIIYPSWLSAYYQLMVHMPYATIDTATLGSYAQANYGISCLRFAGVLLLPLSIPLARLAERGHWLTAASLTLMISLPLAPDGFGLDEMVFLPAIVQMIAWAKGKNSAGQRILPAWARWTTSIGLIAFYILLLAYPKNAANHDHFWLPFALLVIYLVAWGAQKHDTRT